MPSLKDLLVELENCVLLEQPLSLKNLLTSLTSYSYQAYIHHPSFLHLYQKNQLLILDMAGMIL